MSAPGRRAGVGGPRRRTRYLATPSNHVKVFEVQHLFNGSWINETASLEKVNTTANGTGSWPAANYFYIWDTRYSTEG